MIIHTDATLIQAFVVLRAFGQLNFLPAESPGFLGAVESRLSDLFPEMEPQHLLEVKTYYLYIEVYFAFQILLCYVE